MRLFARKSSPKQFHIDDPRALCYHATNIGRLDRREWEGYFDGGDPEEDFILHGRIGFVANAEICRFCIRNLKARLP